MCENLKKMNYMVLISNVNILVNIEMNPGLHACKFDFILIMEK